MDCKTLMQESQFMPLENTILNEIIIRKAEEELGETEQKRKVCLQELKIMIEEEKDLNADISEEFLLGFLRVRKFSVDAAFKLLKKYYLNRQIYPNVYRNFTPKHCHKILKANFLNFLPLRSPEGAAVWVPRLGIWDTDIFSPEEVTKFGLLCAEKEMRNPITQDGIPVRNKAVHVINNPGIFSILFDIMKPFLSKKLRNRIYFHGDNLSSLHQFLPPQMLPEEFGGTQGSFENEQFYECLLANEEEFQQYQKFGYFSSKN
ncbi:alpha-tocopherol transfer protein-like isoform X2 [Stegodyphus dumicola]|uniref:alpha-tocopherol transfer protein-like isoform X2 n=1 Tax=Stegodyphus dumicola TaxID=202533 RepID=UPI0015B30128|nr:alpha-tocopherol transfer protein-like isoform X2 [Stegodyphus dumicola]